MQAGIYIHTLTPDDLIDIIRKAVRDEVEAILTVSKDDDKDYDDKKLMPRTEYMKENSITAPTFLKWEADGIIITVRRGGKVYVDMDKTSNAIRAYKGKKRGPKPHTP